MEADGKRPLNCQYCRSTFRYKQSLNMHIKEPQMNPLQTLPTIHNQMINTNQPTNIYTELVAISQFKPARKFSVIIQNPNLFDWTSLDPFLKLTTNDQIKDIWKISLIYITIELAILKFELNLSLLNLDWFRTYDEQECVNSLVSNISLIA